MLHSYPQNDEEMPDRKVYFMIITTPLHGVVRDSGQDMHGFHMDPIDNELDDFTKKHREGSVVSDLFGPAIAGPSKGPALPPLEEIEQDDDDDDEAPTTRSKSKGKAKAPVTPKSSAKTAVVPPTPIPDPPDMLEDEAVMRNAFINAMKTMRHERQVQKIEKEMVEPPNQVDEFGWATNQTILIRPIFRIWWTGMVKRTFVRTRRYVRRSYCR
jgi:hypothetical protein